LPRRHLRDGPGVRAAPAADARAPLTRGTFVRGPDADRAAQGHTGVPQARRPARARRRLVALSRGDARGDAGGGRATAGRRRVGAARGSHADGLRSRGRGESRRRGSLRGLGAARRRAARARPEDDARGAAGGARRLRGRAAQPTPPARARLRADVLPLRHPGRLRRVPRPAAPPPAHPRVAAAHAAPRLRDARGGRGGGRRGRLDGGPRGVGRAPRRDRGRRAARGRLVRGRDGVPGAFLYGAERPRGDARHRAAHDAPGAPRLPEDLPGDASAHRRARVSQGILHYYFGDKRAILVASLEAVTTDLDRRVAAAQARGGRDPWRRLAALLAACLGLAAEAREFWVVFVEFWGETMHDRQLREIN